MNKAEQIITWENWMKIKLRVLVNCYALCERNVFFLYSSGLFKTMLTFGFPLSPSLANEMCPKNNILMGNNKCRNIVTSEFIMQVIQSLTNASLLKYWWRGRVIWSLHLIYGNNSRFHTILYFGDEEKERNLRCWRNLGIIYSRYEQLT